MSDKEILIDCTVNSVLDIAAKEVGYKEGSNNNNKFAAELDKIKYYDPQKKQNVAWCSIFVTWCFYKAFGLLCRDILFQPVKNNYSASCTEQYNYYKKNKATSNKPGKGYQIFFKGSDGKINHTGIIYKVDSKKIYTIEGNKSNQVKKCSYNLNSTKIYAYGIPKYDININVVDVKPKPVESKPKKESYTVIAKSGLNVREKATDTSKILRVLSYGSKIKGEDIGEWIKLDKGYIFKKWTVKTYSNDY